MDKELENRIIKFLEVNYDATNFNNELPKWFSEEEIYEMLLTRFVDDNNFIVNCFVEDISRSNYIFSSNFAFNKIMECLNNLDSLQWREIASVCRNLSEEHVYQIIKKCGTIKSDRHPINRILHEIIESKDSDEFKERVVKDRLLKSEDYCYLNYNIVRSMKDETVKAKCLKYLNSWDRAQVIEKFESDYLKQKYLTLFGSEKGVIIASFESDSLKEKNLRKYWYVLSSSDKGFIIGNFEKKELIYLYARKVILDEAKVSIIEQVYDKLPDLCLELLSTMKKQECIADAVRYMECDIKVLPYAVKVKKDEYIINMFRNCSFDVSPEILKILEGCSDKVLKEFLVRCRGQENFYMMLPYVKNFELIEELFDHVEEYIEYSVELEPLINRYINEYKVNKDHLLFLLQTFNISLLKYLKSTNLQNLLNLNESEFYKIMQIMNIQNIKMNDDAFNNSVNALLQRKFRLKVPEITMIFPTALQAIEDCNKKELSEMLDVLVESLSEEEVYNDYCISKEKFVDKLVAKDKVAIDLLRELTSKFIKLKRNEYVKNEFNNSKDSSMNGLVDFKRTIKAIIASYPIGTIMHFFDVKEYVEIYDDINDEEMSLIQDRERLLNIIKYKKNPIENKELFQVVKEDFKVFDSLCERVFNNYVLEKISYDLDVSKNYVHKDVNKDNLLTFLAELDVEKMKIGVLSDELLFDSMMSQLKQYAFLGWLGSFDVLAFESGIPLDSGLIANFIAYYPVIYNELKLKLEAKEIPYITFTSFLDLAACFDSGSKRYSLLLGSDNYNLIASNPPPNSSSSTKEERIKEALKTLKVIRRRRKISVPPVDKDFELKNGKKLNINIGNFNNPINLTYGERTGACMRVNGAGNSLFDFCLRDDNGFHIRFSDPDSGEFISRVSGFRNGNTVFLNQLRHSVNGKYSDVDVVSACELVAQEMVEMSRGSESPIENVVISADMSMERSHKQKKNLGVGDIKQGLGRKFYSDVGSSAILLATANKSGELIPIVLGSEKNKERYNVLRAKPKMFLTNDGIEKMQQIEALDQYLSDVAIDELEIKEFEDIMFCYVGDDWYIKVNKDGSIDSYLMNNSINPMEAEKEMNQVRQIIEAKVQTFNADSMKL